QINGPIKTENAQLAIILIFIRRVLRDFNDHPHHLRTLRPGIDIVQIHAFNLASGRLKSMPKKIRWGVLGVAAIATKKVIPAMKKGERTEIVAIASRELSKARDAAAQLGIPNAYGSYEELLADRSVDAVYNPLPNHLHVPWSAKAAEAGKHVL